MERFNNIITSIRYPGLTFEVGSDTVGDNFKAFWLRVGDPTGRCNVTGASMPWWGRKWRLSIHMTNGEVVQTAFKALMTALEHEAREQFTYKGQMVMGPHLDIDAWAAYLKTHNMEADRANGQ